MNNIKCLKCKSTDILIKKPNTDIIQSLFPNPSLTMRPKGSIGKTSEIIRLVQYTCLSCGYCWIRIDDKEDLNKLSNYLEKDD